MLLDAAPPLADPGAVPTRVMRGRASDGEAMRLALRSSRITAVRVTLRRYVCDPEGDIGPLMVAAVLPATRVHARGIFGFSAGPPSERLRVDGRLSADGRRAGGSMRVHGTIGTGDPCRSPRVTFRLGRAL